MMWVGLVFSSCSGEYIFSVYCKKLNVKTLLPTSVNELE
jgi:hypothetical protein